MIRDQIRELVQLGRFPASQEVVPGIVSRQEALLRLIVPPITDDEARELVTLFGPDDYFGIAWTLLHLVETASHWPLEECLVDETNEWIIRLRKRVDRGRVSDLEARDL